MSQCTTFNAHIADQVLQLSNVPRIASGSKNALVISCTFCGKWEGCENVAVFVREGVGVFHVLVEDGLVTVPHEVLANEGYFEMGFLGVDDLTRTTELVRVPVAKGANAPATAVPDPTPSLYEQLLASFGQAIAMKSPTGSTVYNFTDTRLPKGIIASNGAAAYVSFTLRGMTVELADVDYYETGYIIPPAFTPLVLATLTDINELNNVRVVFDPEHANEEGWLKIEVSKNDGKTPMNLEAFYGFYDLASVSIEELANARIGYDGTEYPTAGDAIRAQVSAAMQAVENGKGIVMDDELDFHSEHPVTNKALTKAFDEVHEHIGRVGLPAIGADDEGKTAQVVNGLWQVVKPTPMPVDDELDPTSRNPLQNRVIAQMMADAGSTLSGITAALNKVVQDMAALEQELQNVQVPVDAELSETSENPVQNKVITALFNEASEVLNQLGGAVAVLQSGITVLGEKTLPDVTTADNDKILRVVGGKWAAVEIHSAESASF